MVKCCIRGCRSSSKNVFNDAVRLHRFPTKNEELRRKWIKFALRSGTKISKLDMSDRNNTRICSQHFRDRDRNANPEPSIYPPDLTLVDLEEGSAEAKMAASLNQEEEDLAGEYRITGVTSSLEELIDAKLTELDFSSLISDSISKLEKKVTEEQRKARMVSKIFADCEKQLKSFRHVLEQEQDIETPEIIPSGSDSDDDVQFVQATFEPGFTRTTKATGMTRPPPGSMMVRNSRGQHHYYIAGTSDSGRIVMRQASVGSKDMAASLRSQPHSKQISKTGHVIGGDPDLIAVSGPQVLRPLTTIHAPPPKQIDLVVGTKLYAKKFNDIWYKGTLMEIVNKDKSRNEWKYKVKFDGKGSKVLPGKQVAFADSPKDTLPVGSRVVALYKDEELSTAASYYAGIVAESPSVRNTQRYLVFFDDGYAQYCYSRELHKVYEQSRNVWDDIHPDSQEFIKSYLKQYPERPMVRLQPGQVIKTEWKGRWWTARVQVVDGSLVKMYFDADKRVEWIYRGSTRLEPLYTELANAELSKTQGKGHRRHNLNVKSNKKPLVEYLRGTEEDFMRRKQPGHMGQPQRKHPVAYHGPQMTGEQLVCSKLPAVKPGNIYQAGSPASSIHTTHQRVVFTSGHTTPSPASRQHSSDGTPPITNLNTIKKRPVARKSTAKNQHNESSGEKRHQYHASSLSRNAVGRDMASVLQDRLANEFADDEEALGERMQIDRGLVMMARKKYKAHECSHNCLKEHDDNPILYKGNNPLIIPMLCGWERQIARQKNTGKRVVAYRAPCGRRLRTIKEVHKYLSLTDSLLTIDLFCFDSNLHTHSEFVPIKTFCDIKDLSYGKENVPISCVNGIDRAYPDYVEYSNQRIPAKGVVLNLETDYLIGCSCTDGCIDPTKCECAQLTIEASKASSASRPDGSPVGYQERRLMEPVFTGIYECNSRCRCDHRCNNRVAQNGLQLRLQVFKTEKRGWGLRCLDDIPAGGFICIYAGQLLTEQGANEDGQQYGDEYLAELDYIEVVERMKEGYESDVDPNIDEGIGNDEDEESDDFQGASDSDSDAQSTGSGLTDKTSNKSRTETCSMECTFSGEKYLGKSGAHNKSGNRRKSSATGESQDQSLSTKIVLKRDSGADDQDKSWSVRMKGISPQKQTAEWLKSIPPPPSLDAIVISDEEDPYPRAALYMGPSKKPEAALSKTPDSESKPEKEAETSTDLKEKLTPSPAEGDTTTAERENVDAGSDKEGESKNEQEEDEGLVQDNVVTVPDSDHKDSSVSSHDNGSDLDSLGEHKLDKPVNSPPKKMFLKLKTNIQGDMKNKESPFKSEIDFNRKPLRIPRIKDKATHHSFNTSGEVDSPDTPSTPANVEENLDIPKLIEALESEDSQDVLPGQTDGQDDEKPKEDTAPPPAPAPAPPLPAPPPAGPESADGNNSDSKDGLEENGLFKRTTRSQTSRFRDLPDPKSQQVISPLKIKLSTMEIEGREGAEEDSKKEEKPADKSITVEGEDLFSTRMYFGEEFCYVMDAKSMGNIGRYLNHSCAPNVFVQNVFVDTHDLRFPWVAFFAGQYIRAGTELTWDYNYEVGSVPGKVLYCYCGAAECRGRLL